MPRPPENKLKIQCRIEQDKKAVWDELLIKAGFYCKHKENISPTYGKFLESLLDCDVRAFSIIVQIFSKKIENLLDKSK